MLPNKFSKVDKKFFCGMVSIVTSECTALLGQKSGFGGVFGQWLQLMHCTNLLLQV